MMVRRLPRHVVLLSALALLSACATIRGTDGAHQSATATERSAARIARRTEAIVTLLNQGDEAKARRKLQSLLKHHPDDADARVLEESLDRDPVALLGPYYQVRVVEPGETMIGLAERFLGNRLKFYQLARYNHIKIPATLAPGTPLRIPGEPPRPAPPPPEPKPARPAPPPPPEPRPTVKPTPPAPAATVPAANPALARQLRTAGLAALNQGHVTRAVVLLRRAALLDPDNPLIARDLARAERIARAVQARK